MMIKRMLCCGAATLILTTLPAGAVKIDLVDQGGFAGSEAQQGYEIAARYWESVLTNDVTITFGVGWSNWGSAARGLGSAGSASNDYAVTDWVAGVGATRSDSLLDQSVVLPSVDEAGGVSLLTNGSAEGGTSGIFYNEGETRSTRVLNLQTSVIKAVGGTATYADNPDSLDGALEFNSAAKWDFDPTDGIAEGSVDFIGVVIHEMGHSLGFSSGVDTWDYILNTELDYNQHDVATFTALDMFRYSPDEGDVAPGDDPVIDASISTASYFSIDGGKTALAGNLFSAGYYEGDGKQASHWKDADCDKGTTLGIMDPTTCYSQGMTVSALDLATYDAIGWNLSADVRDDPSYTASTADIYRQFATAVPEPATWAMMICGFALVGAASRARSRPRVSLA